MSKFYMVIRKDELNVVEKQRLSRCLFSEDYQFDRGNWRHYTDKFSYQTAKLWVDSNDSLMMIPYPEN